MASFGCATLQYSCPIIGASLIKSASSMDLGFLQQVRRRSRDQCPASPEAMRTLQESSKCENAECIRQIQPARIASKVSPYLQPYDPVDRAGIAQVSSSTVVVGSNDAGVPGVVDLRTTKRRSRLAKPQLVADWFLSGPEDRHGVGLGDTARYSATGRSWTCRFELARSTKAKRVRSTVPA